MLRWGARYKLRVCIVEGSSSQLDAISKANPDYFKAPIFGSMRLGDLSYKKCIEILQFILENGGRRFHSSTEYDSFDQFTDCLKTACVNAGINQNSLGHIVKIATPHFGETRFDYTDLAKKIDQYQNSLGCEQLETIQWMVRGDLANEGARINCMHAQVDEITEAVHELKTQGSILRFGNFPYTQSFRQEVLKQPWCDVLLDYYNPMENSDLDFEKFGDKSFIAIRPFYPVLTSPEGTNHTIPDLLKFALKPGPSESVIVSASKKEHVKEILTAMY
jgi:diketogulonate reductase-like aldo/keto reductase